MLPLSFMVGPTLVYPWFIQTTKIMAIKMIAQSFYGYIELTCIILVYIYSVVHKFRLWNQNQERTNFFNEYTK